MIANFPNHVLIIIKILMILQEPKYLLDSFSPGPYCVRLIATKSFLW
jgi:hypothetical protein